MYLKFILVSIGIFSGSVFAQRSISYQEYLRNYVTADNLWLTCNVITNRVRNGRVGIEHVLDLVISPSIQGKRLTSAYAAVNLRNQHRAIDFGVKHGVTSGISFDLSWTMIKVPLVDLSPLVIIESMVASKKDRFDYNFMTNSSNGQGVVSLINPRYNNLEKYPLNKNSYYALYCASHTPADFSFHLTDSVICKNANSNRDLIRKCLKVDAITNWKKFAKENAVPDRMNEFTKYVEENGNQVLKVIFGNSLTRLLKY